MTMKPLCREYRKSMELLGLRLQLEKRPLNPKEREEIENRVKALEKELDME